MIRDETVVRQLFILGGSLANTVTKTFAI